EAHASSSQGCLHHIDDNEATKSLSATSSSDVNRASKSIDAQSQKGWSCIEQGDQCRDRGEFKEAEKFYSQASKHCPSEAQDRLKELPQFSAFSESNESDRTISAGLKARVASMAGKFAQMFKRSSQSSTLEGSFFPRPTLSTQSPFASQCTSMSVPTSLSISISASRSALASETIINTANETPDTSSLVNSYIKADPAAKAIIRDQVNKVIEQFEKSPISFDSVQELVVLANIPD
ncbi:hypothetical protein BGX26_006250, partial [Mortierella sp. AD094]